MGRSWLVAALVAGSTTLAAAQPGAPAKVPTAADKAKAGELIKQAIAKSQSGDHEHAIDLYKDAYKIAPLPLLLSNLGSEYKAMGKSVEALDYFCQYIKADPTGTNVSYATSEARVIQTDLKNPNADKDVCAPQPPKDAPPPPPPPHEPMGISVTPVVENPGRGLETAGLVVGGAGVLSLAIGIYFGAQAASISDSITNHDPMKAWANDIKDQEAKGQSDENKQVIFLAVGGVALASGGILYLLGHAKNGAVAEHNVAVVPLATSEGTGLVVSGRF